MASDSIPQGMSIVTRAEAIRLGQKWYFTGKPCKRGHISPRTTKRRHCPVCVEQYYKSEGQLQKARDRYKRGGDAARKRAQSWSKANPEKWRVAVVEWSRANPHKAVEYANRRRARKAANGGDHSAEEVLNLYQRQRGCCAECGKSIKRGYEEDHVIPLFLGGTNNISNIQLLCRPCNRRKGHKHPIDWALENGRLV